MYNDLDRVKYNINPVIGDKKQLLNALIGDGLPGRTEQVVEIVMKYIEHLESERDASRTDAADDRGKTSVISLVERVGLG